MNIYQQGFRTNILDTIFKVVGQIWLKVTGGYAIYYITTIILVAIAFLMFIFDGADFDIFGELMNPENLRDPEELKRIADDLSVVLLTPRFAVVIGVLSIIVLVLVSWSYYFAFLVANQQITERKSDFNTAFGKSLGTDVFKLLLALILIYVILLVGSVAAAMTINVSGYIAFLLFVLLFIGIFKLTLIVPAIAVGNLSISEAFSFSLKHITWLRALKLFGISILATFAFSMAAVIIWVMSLIFAFIPILGQIVQLAINIMISGFIMAFTVSALTGLYYRYADEIEDQEEDDIGRHLVPDSSLS
ncbi:hypothetical protein QQ008_13320 [Fulvivirgaceae bacterium BMA10]|uniref:Uncharacterized protein n=1 Tax=Splendidivirga corallicola TaxID=3051826 RepID=A0ABT8KNP6_9BACT|nr:hypothetical protein [Fulvivirgaceae bacterium BMA10]